MMKENQATEQTMKKNEAPEEMAKEDKAPERRSKRNRKRTTKGLSFDEELNEFLSADEYSPDHSSSVKVAKKVDRSITAATCPNGRAVDIPKTAEIVATTKSSAAITKTENKKTTLVVEKVPPDFSVMMNNTIDNNLSLMEEIELAELEKTEQVSTEEAASDSEDIAGLLFMTPQNNAGKMNVLATHTNNNKSGNVELNDLARSDMNNPGDAGDAGLNSQSSEVEEGGNNDPTDGVNNKMSTEDEDVSVIKLFDVIYSLWQKPTAAETRFEDPATTTTTKVVLDDESIVSDVLKENDELREKYRSRDQAIYERDIRIKQLQEAIENLNAEVENHRNTVEGLHKTVRVLKSQIDSHKTEAQAHNKVVERLQEAFEEERGKYEAERNRLKDNISHYMVENTKLQEAFEEECGKYEVERNRLNDSILHHMAENKKLQEVFEEERGKYEVDQTRLNDNISHYMDENTKLKSLIKQMRNRSRSSSISSESSTDTGSDVDSVAVVNAPISKEVSAIREDLSNFQKFMYDELQLLKAAALPPKSPPPQQQPPHQQQQAPPSLRQMPPPPPPQQPPPPLQQPPQQQQPPPPPLRQPPPPLQQPPHQQQQVPPHQQQQAPPPSQQQMAPPAPLQPPSLIPQQPPPPLQQSPHQQQQAPPLQQQRAPPPAQQPPPPPLQQPPPPLQQPPLQQPPPLLQQSPPLQQHPGTWYAPSYQVGHQQHQQPQQNPNQHPLQQTLPTSQQQHQQYTPQPASQLQGVQQQHLPLVPGDKLYSNAHVKTTMIIADSTPGRININQIKNNINLAEENVIFKRYQGQTADEISYYAPKPLNDTKPEQVVVIAGTNDMSKAVYTGETIDEYKIVENVRKIGVAARDCGAKRIHISSVLVRRGHEYRNAIVRINNLLRTMCNEERFIFMDQSDITSAHISGDGIHPNFNGSTILKHNILSVFSTFNPYVCDFGAEYERALF